MNPNRKILALLFAAFFIISAIAALFCFTLEWQAFNSASYKQAFTDQHLYGQMPSLLANVLADSMINDANADPYLKALNGKELQNLIESILPPDEIKTLTDNALEATFDYLNGKSDSAVISIAFLKKHLHAQDGVPIIKLILQSQPDCTAEQLLQMGLGLFSGNTILCNVPDELLGFVAPLVDAQWQSAISALPDQFNLLPASIHDSRLKLNRIRLLMKITPIFPLFFLFSLVAIRNPTDWLQWWGWLFLITGVISALFAWLGTPVFRSILVHSAQSQGADLIPPILFSLLEEIFTAVAGQLLKPVIIEGVIISFLGSGLIISDLLYSQIKHRQAS